MRLSDQAELIRGCYIQRTAALRRRVMGDSPDVRFDKSCRAVIK